MRAPGQTDVPEALGLQGLEDLYYLALRPDHAYIASSCLYRPAQNSHIITVTAGDDYDVRGLIRIQLLHGFVEIEDMDIMGAWETLFGGVGGAIVGDNYLEAGTRGCAAKITVLHDLHRIYKVMLEEARAPQILRVSRRKPARVVPGSWFKSNFKVRGFSDSMTSRAACQTSASTHPPPMVPTMEPSSRTSIFAV